MWEIQIKIHFQKLRKNFEYKILKWKKNVGNLYSNSTLKKSGEIQNPLMFKSAG